MMMVHYSQMRILERLMVSSYMFVGGHRIRFLMHRPYCTSERWRFGLRMIGMLHAFSASCVFPFWLHASLPFTYNWLFSLMNTSCLSLRPPAAMTDGWFTPVVFVTLSWSTTIMLSIELKKLLKKTAFGMHVISILWDLASPAQLHLKQAGQAGYLEDLFVWHLVLPFDTKDGMRAVLMKPLKWPDLLPVENPGLCNV